jgi:SAM-dependent methyltransferase
MSVSGNQKQLTYEEALSLLRQRIPNRIHAGGPNLIAEANLDAVYTGIEAIGLPIERQSVDVNYYDSFYKSAEYETRYPDYYRANQREKSFEHYWAFHVMEPKAGFRYIDIGSERSPLPEIFDRLSGSITYSQDLSYPPGMTDKRIGGDAAQLPVPDAFFDGAVVTCSIEHFEGESDIGFMREMTRVLKPGGKVLVLPLYIHTVGCYYTDPVCVAQGDVPYDPKLDVYCVKGWGNRHGRIYSASTLWNRLIEPNPEIDFCVHYLKDAEKLGSSVYCRFALLGTRKTSARDGNRS